MNKRYHYRVVQGNNYQSFAGRGGRVRDNINIKNRDTSGRYHVNSFIDDHQDWRNWAATDVPCYHNKNNSNNNNNNRHNHQQSFSHRQNYHYFHHHHHQQYPNGESGSGLPPQFHNNSAGSSERPYNQRRRCRSISPQYQQTGQAFGSGAEVVSIEDDRTRVDLSNNVPAEQQIATEVAMCNPRQSTGRRYASSLFRRRAIQQAAGATSCSTTSTHTFAQVSAAATEDKSLLGGNAAASGAIAPPTLVMVWSQPQSKPAAPTVAVACSTVSSVSSLVSGSQPQPPCTHDNSIGSSHAQIPRHIIQHAAAAAAHILTDVTSEPSPLLLPGSPALPASDGFFSPTQEEEVEESATEENWEPHCWRMNGSKTVVGAALGEDPGADHCSSGGAQQQIQSRKPVPRIAKCTGRDAVPCTTGKIKVTGRKECESSMQLERPDSEMLGPFRAGKIQITDHTESREASTQQPERPIVADRMKDSETLAVSHHYSPVLLLPPLGEDSKNGGEINVHSVPEQFASFFPEEKKLKSLEAFNTAVVVARTPPFSATTNNDDDEDDDSDDEGFDEERYEGLPDGNPELLRVGTRVAVFWNGDGVFFEGVIQRERPHKKKCFFVKYDDGDEKWLNFRKIKFYILSGGKIIKQKREEFSHNDWVNDDNWVLGAVGKKNRKGKTGTIAVDKLIPKYDLAFEEAKSSRTESALTLPSKGEQKLRTEPPAHGASEQLFSDESESSEQPPIVPKIMPTEPPISPDWKKAEPKMARNSDRLDLSSLPEHLLQELLADGFIPVSERVKLGRRKNHSLDLSSPVPPPVLPSSKKRKCVLAASDDTAIRSDAVSRVDKPRKKSKSRSEEYSEEYVSDTAEPEKRLKKHSEQRTVGDETEKKQKAVDLKGEQSVQSKETAVKDEQEALVSPNQKTTLSGAPVPPYRSGVGESVVASQTETSPQKLLTENQQKKVVDKASKKSALPVDKEKKMLFVSEKDVQQKKPPPAITDPVLLAKQRKLEEIMARQDARRKRLAEERNARTGATNSTMTEKSRPLFDAGNGRIGREKESSPGVSAVNKADGKHVSKELRNRLTTGSLGGSAKTVDPSSAGAGAVAEHLSKEANAQKLARIAAKKEVKKLRMAKKNYEEQPRMSTDVVVFPKKTCLAPTTIRETPSELLTVSEPGCLRHKEEKSAKVLKMTSPSPERNIPRSGPSAKKSALLTREEKLAKLQKKMEAVVEKAATNTAAQQALVRSSPGTKTDKPVVFASVLGMPSSKEATTRRAATDDAGQTALNRTPPGTTMDNPVVFASNLDMPSSKEAMATRAAIDDVRQAAMNGTPRDTTMDNPVVFASILDMPSSKEAMARRAATDDVRQAAMNGTPRDTTMDKPVVPASILDMPSSKKATAKKAATSDVGQKALTGGTPPDTTMDKPVVPASILDMPSSKEAAAKKAATSDVGQKAFAGTSHGAKTDNRVSSASARDKLSSGDKAVCSSVPRKTSLSFLRLKKRRVIIESDDEDDFEKPVGTPAAEEDSAGGPKSVNSAVSVHSKKRKLSCEPQPDDSLADTGKKRKRKHKLSTEEPCKSAYVLAEQHNNKNIKSASLRQNAILDCLGHWTIEHTRIKPEPAFEVSGGKTPLLKTTKEGITQDDGFEKHSRSGFFEAEEPCIMTKKAKLHANRADENGRPARPRAGPFDSTERPKRRGEEGKRSSSFMETSVSLKKIEKGKARSDNVDWECSSTSFETESACSGASATGTVVEDDDTHAYAEQKKDESRTLTPEEIRAILGEEDECAGSSNWVRRSSRMPSRSALMDPNTRVLLQELPLNGPDMVVLKMKKYVSDPAAPCVVIDAVLDALEQNTNCQSLYIQNYNEGMQDRQVLRLLEILQKPSCNIWCLNIGETYKVKRKTWKKFARGLKYTKITHMYASEHTISAGMKEYIRDTIRENRKKHDMHIDPNNLDVIVKCTHCWWNPINAKVLRPYLHLKGYAHILHDKEAQGARGSKSGEKQLI